MMVKKVVILCLMLVLVCISNIPVFPEDAFSVQIQPGIDVFIGDSIFTRYGFNFELGYDAWSLDWGLYTIQTAVNAGLSNRINAGWAPNANVAFTIFPKKSEFETGFKILQPSLYGITIRRSLYYSFEDNDGTTYTSEFYDINAVLYKYRREGHRNYIGIGSRFAPRKTEEGYFLNGLYVYFKLY